MESTEARRPQAVENIATWLRLLLPEDPSAVFEIRALGCSTADYRRPHNRGGYFSVASIDAAADAAAALTRTASARGVYFTLNPLSPALLARRANRVDVLSRDDSTACDADILSRRWMLIDCDPTRPSGVSSSSAEHDAAKQTALQIRNHLHSLKWPDPILCDSGNGWHLLYRVDLPAADNGIIQRCLHALSDRFSSSAVGVDKSVFNPARICKLYGTFSRKGDHTEDRPHRLSRVVRLPSGGVQIVPANFLESLAAEAPDKFTRRNDVKPPPANSIIERARRYAAAADASVSGQHGHDVAYKLACALVVGFALPHEDALGVMAEWNERCSPPWSDVELVRKLEEAERSADDERGWLLRGDSANSAPRRLNVEAVTFEPFGQGESSIAFPATSPAASTIITTRETSTREIQKSDLQPIPVYLPSHPAPQWQRPLIAKPLQTEAIIVDDDPHRLAEVFLRQHTAADGSYTLRAWKECWWASDGSRYVQISPANLKAAINIAIKREFNRIAEERLRHANPEKAPPTSKPVTAQTVANAMHAVHALTSLPDNLDQPTWLGGKFSGRHPRDFVSLTNGILDVSAAITAIEADPLDEFPGVLAAALAPHSSLWFAQTAMPYHFDPTADCPRWRAFLETNLEGDEESIAMLQEWFGYCLTPDLSYQKFLMMEGEGRNGKSVICCVLRAILGGDNVSHVPLELFGERFALTQTLGKLANIASEVGEIDRAAEGILKAFVAGDRMTFDRKGINAIEAVPTARLVFATNNRPRFSDRSTGLWRRMLLLSLTYQVPDGQQVYGMDSPEYWRDELPGIFNWALRGLVAIRRQRGFTQSSKSREGVAEYQRETNPARQFLQEQYEVSEGGIVECNTLYQHYTAWCKSSGFSPLNSSHFGREVLRVFKSAEKKRVGDRSGRAYCYVGISKSVDELTKPEDQEAAADSAFPEWST